MDKKEEGKVEEPKGKEEGKASSTEKEEGKEDKGDTEAIDVQFEEDDVQDDDQDENENDDQERKQDEDDDVPVVAFGQKGYKDTIQVNRGHKQRKSLDEVPDLGLPRSVKFL